MALGYEGYCLLNTGLSSQTYLLATAVTAPRTRVKLESSSGYGGRIKTPVDEIGIGSPHNYDKESYNGSVSYEATIDALSDHIKPWLFDRQANGASLEFVTRLNGNQTLTSVYWNSLTLSARENSAIEGGIGFVAKERFYTFGDTGTDGYIDNKEGQHLGCPSPSGLDPLSGDNLFPIPFWNSTVEFDSTSLDFMEWNLDYSQDISEFYSCEGNSSAQLPSFIAAGPMSARFSGTYMFEAPTSDTVNQIKVTAGSGVGTSVEFKLNVAEASVVADDLQGIDALTPIVVEYDAYEIEV